MDDDSLSGDYDIDLNSEDERAFESFATPSSTSLVVHSALANSAKTSMMAGSSGSKASDNFVSMGFDEKLVAEAIQEHGEDKGELILERLLKHSASSSASSPTSKMATSSLSSPTSEMINRFIGMGFTNEQISQAIKENVDGDAASILDTLLTLQAVAESPLEDHPKFSEIDYDLLSSENEEHGFSDMDSSGDEEFTNFESGEESNLTSLRRMGYSAGKASIAIERCGPDATMLELVDFLHAAGMAKEDPSFYAEEVKPKSIMSNHKKRGLCEFDSLKRRKQQRLGNGDDELIQLPNPMVGFGLPNSELVTERQLPKGAIGPPFFYYENVARTPAGVWQTISSFLYDVKPEFVDSMFFCAAARKRGYVHNLPIHNRHQLLPLPPQTIHEALPMTKRWWPSWDPRVKLNCLNTCTASAELTKKIRKAIEKEEGDPLDIQKKILEHCRKWNLVWVGKNKVAALEPDEIEMLLGFPKNHTRGISSRTDRFKSLGNSFQVDTVAYHLSTLRDLFPKGLNLLSLFSGIGGAEVALHRLGIRLNNVVSVEISETNRGIVRAWWEQTNQTGQLIDDVITDVEELTAEKLKKLMDSIGGFDLVIGGSPCNNLTGSNRHHRDGLQGRESSLFYEYFRILDAVKNYNRR